MAISRDTIVAEIKRGAANDGKSPGMGALKNETGIKRDDWQNRYWVRWSEALAEAGLTPNSLQDPFEEAELFNKLIGFIREIGRFPVKGEFIMRSHARPALADQRFCCSTISQPSMAS